METTIEAIVKLLAVIVPICGGLLWIIKQNRRIEKSQAAMLKKVNKIDKHKVSPEVLLRAYQNTITQLKNEITVED